MALGTYTDLQTAVAAELNRSDVAQFIPDFITRFEAKAKRSLREWLRATLTLTNVTADTVLAATVGDVLSVAYNDGTSGAHNFILDVVSREDYQRWMESQSIPSSTAGQLVYVDFDADAGTTTLRFWPSATASGPIANLKVEYVKILPALSATQTTNALLREAPDAYLYGACAEAAKYLQHDERIAVWSAERDAAFTELRILTERRLYGAHPRRVSLPRVFG
jgi:hypothetical protein